MTKLKGIIDLVKPLTREEDTSTIRKKNRHKKKKRRKIKKIKNIDPKKWDHDKIFIYNFLDDRLKQTCLYVLLYGC